jgi:hypothetical protein
MCGICTVSSDFSGNDAKAARELELRRPIIYTGMPPSTLPMM